jgi:thioredoxin reductase
MGVRDVLIIGGGFAGLSAALQLGRAGRTVTVIDAGRPRNRMSPAAHGVPGADGIAPVALLERIRRDVAAYPTVEVEAGEIRDASGGTDAFAIDRDGRTLNARRIVLAHGVTDILPDIPGLAENWGRTVLQCPYCHGHEVRGRPLAVIATGAHATHQARLLRADWSPQVTVFLAPSVVLDEAARETLAAAGIAADDRAVVQVEGRHDSIAITLAGGEALAFGAVFTASRVAFPCGVAETLGCATGDGPHGPFLRVGAMGQTSVAGVFAAGDAARPGHAVTLALGDGVAAGTGCHQSLVFPGFIQPIAAEGTP